MLEPEAYAALLDAMERENEQIAAEIKVTGLGLGLGGVELTTSHKTEHGTYWHKAVRADEPTIEVVRELLTYSVALHARRMPKHQELAALAKEGALSRPAPEPKTIIQESNGEARR